MALGNVVAFPGAVDPGLTRERLVEVVVANYQSPHTRRCYGMWLERFNSEGYSLDRDGVIAYMVSLGWRKRAGVALAAVRQMAREAHLRKLLGADELAGILAVKPPRDHRTRVGNWLTVEQVQQYLGLPDRATWTGARDAALLCIMVGCGLRREEVCELGWDQVQLREGRWCLVDFAGKGDKARTVPVPGWAVADIKRWRVVSQTPAPDPPVPWRNLLQYQCRPKPERVTGGMSPEGLRNLVRTYAQRLGLEINPHDLRRTLARLLNNAGTPLEQIQFMLGHTMIATTVKYLGSALELREGMAAVDQLAITAAPEPVEAAEPVNMAEQVDRELGRLEYGVKELPEDLDTLGGS